MATFPATKRYFLRFRQTDTGLTPTFLYFNNAESFAPISPPTIYEVNGAGEGNGSYYFDYVYATKSDPAVVFNVDGGASIPTEEIRYIGDNIGPSDCYLDEPISQVVTDVWSDVVSYGAGEKGFFVSEIGTYGDPSATGSLFGQIVWAKEQVRGDDPATSDGESVAQVYSRIGAPVSSSISADIASVQTGVTAIEAKTNNLPADPASQSTTSSEIAAISTLIGTPATSTVSGDIAQIEAQTTNLPADPASQSVTDTAISASTTAIVGPQSLTISEIAGGASFDPSADTLHDLATNASSLTEQDVANAVWNEPLSSHSTAGTGGQVLSQAGATLATLLQIQTGRWQILNYQMLFYAEDGVTVLYTLNLLDQNGNPTNTAVFQRVPV